MDAKPASSSGGVGSQLNFYRTKMCVSRDHYFALLPLTTYIVAKQVPSTQNQIMQKGGSCA